MRAYPPACRPAGRPKDIEKRQAILVAAEHLFLSEGFERTTMDAVARDACVSKITVYSHFDNKATLFQEVVNTICADYNVGSWGDEILEMPIDEALYTIGCNYLRLVSSPRIIAMHRIIEAEAVRHPTMAYLLYEVGPTKVRANFRRLIEAWAARGELHADKHAIAAEQYFSVLKGDKYYGLMLNVRDTPEEPEITEYARSCADLFLSRYGKRGS